MQIQPQGAVSVGECNIVSRESGLAPGVVVTAVVFQGYFNAIIENGAVLAREKPAAVLAGVVELRPWQVGVRVQWLLAKEQSLSGFHIMKFNHHVLYLRGTGQGSIAHPVAWCTGIEVFLAARVRGETDSLGA